MDTLPNTVTNKNFQPQIYFLGKVDDQIVRILQAMVQGQSARMQIPRDGDQFRRLIPIISSCLLQEKRVLVISPTEEHLGELNKVLTENNLSGLSFRVQETQQMYTQLQLSLVGKRVASQLDKDRWHYLETQCKRLADLLDAQYHGLLSPVFGKHNRQNLMAAYVSAHQVTSKAWLAGLIPGSDIDFSMDRFSQMKNNIELAEKQYQGQLDHPLSQLHEHFYSISTDEATKSLKKQLDHFINLALNLRRSTLSRVDLYQSSLQHYYDQHYYDCASILRELIHRIEDFVTQHGQSLAEVGGLSPRKSLFGLINGQQTSDPRQPILDKYHELYQTHQQIGEVDFQLPAAAECYQPVPMLNQYQAALIDWHQSVPQIIQDQLIRLNRKTVHPASTQLIAITELEQQLEDFIEQLNQSNLFNKPVINNSLTILQQQELLNDVIRQLEAVQSVVQEFDTFSKWQRHWLQCDPTTKQLILQLTSAGARDWLSIFETWFWYQCLLQLSIRDLPRNDHALEQLTKASAQLQQLIPDYLLALQQSHWPAARQVQNQLKQISPENAKEIIELARSCFPLLVCTEDQVDNLLTKQFQTDVLIVLDAAFLPEKTIRPLARQHLLTSDCKLQSDKSPVSLWQEPGLGSIDFFKLDVMTGSTPPGLRFYLASLFGNLDQSPSANQPIVLFPVMGRTDKTDHSNEAEARQIIQYLHQLQSLEDGRPPRNLNILCATEGQQKRIRYYLKESLRRKVAGADWLAALQEKGLRILTFSEIKGQQTDRVIVSLVMDGTTTNSMGWLLDKKESSVIRALLSAALKQFVIFHSISEEVRTEWLKSNHSALNIFANWLGYGRAVSKSIGSQQKKILQTVALGKTKKRPAVPLIYRAIGQALFSYFPTDRIQLAKVSGQLYFPLIVWPEVTNETGVVILVDQLVNEEAMYPWLGSQRLKDAAKQHGFEVVETWSASWWQDPDQAARQLAGKVMRIAQFREAY